MLEWSAFQWQPFLCFLIVIKGKKKKYKRVILYFFT